MGATALGLVQAGEQLGFTAYGVHGSVEDLVTSEDLVLPAIAHVTTDEGLPHFIVIHRLKGDTVTIADPARGLRTITLGEFAARWTGALIILEPGSQGLVPAHPDRTGFRRFVGLLRAQGRLLWLISAASLLVTAIGVVGAFYLQIIIDQIVPQSLAGKLTAVSVAIIGLYVVRALLDAGRYHLVLHVQKRIDADLVLGYYHHITSLPMSFFGARRTGDIIARFEDAGRIREALAAATVTVFVDVVMSIGGCFILATQDLVLFGVAAGVAGAHGVLALVVARPIHRLNEELMEANSLVTSHFVESVEGAETIKAHNAQSQVRGKADRYYAAYLARIFRQGRWRNAQAVTADALGTLGTTIIVWLGAIQVMEGRLTIGGLVVFITLLDYFLTPVRNLANLQPELQTAAVAARRLNDILVVEPEALGLPGQAELTSLSVPIHLDDLSFRYGGRSLVLDQVSLTIPPGASVGVVGGSGSGKTTIAKLLMRLYIPESGRIRFGRTPIEEFTSSSIRDRIAYIGQDTAFFSGSIAENLRLGCPHATTEQMVRACRMADAHDFIVAMAGQYQSLLEEGASNLSGGQRQRLAIARALLRRADMLILDEATSSLDSISEQAVSDTVQRLRGCAAGSRRGEGGSAGGVTRLIIAHRLSTVVDCDIIYVLDRGRVVESGAHQELLSFGGLYSELWRAQYGSSGERASTRQPVS
jgi:ATP-binding cassette subfamily B protein